MKLLSLAVFSLVFIPEILPAQPTANTDTLFAINVSSLNSSDADLFPFLTFDEKNIYFSRTENGKVKIWSAERRPDSTWSDPKEVPGTDKLGNIGAYICDTLGEVFFASDYGAKARNDIDLFCFVDGKITNLGSPVNTTQWETQPSISPDGHDLYFASNREGPLTKINIFVTHKLSDGKWSEPVNLGPKINSRSYNGSPFILSDKKTLLFASGITKLKLYISFKTGSADVDWSDPVELPFPINNAATSFTPCLSQDNHELYFASDRIGGKGKMDIYMVRLPHGLESLYPPATK